MTTSTTYKKDEHDVMMLRMWMRHGEMWIALSQKIHTDDEFTSSNKSTEIITRKGYSKWC